MSQPPTAMHAKRAQLKRPHETSIARRSISWAPLYHGKSDCPDTAPGLIGTSILVCTCSIPYLARVDHPLRQIGDGDMPLPSFRQGVSVVESLCTGREHRQHRARAAVERGWGGVRLACVHRLAVGQAGDEWSEFTACRAFAMRTFHRSDATHVSDVHQ